MILQLYLRLINEVFFRAKLCVRLSYIRVGRKKISRVSTSYRAKSATADTFSVKVFVLSWPYYCPSAPFFAAAVPCAGTALSTSVYSGSFMASCNGTFASSPGSGGGGRFAFRPSSYCLPPSLPPFLPAASAAFFCAGGAPFLPPAYAAAAKAAAAPSSSRLRASSSSRRFWYQLNSVCVT